MYIQYISDQHLKSTDVLNKFVYVIESTETVVMHLTLLCYLITNRTKYNAKKCEKRGKPCVSSLVPEVDLRWEWPH